MNRLAGKVAIVTGAATGLGRDIARVYAEEGALVVIADFRPAEGGETVEAIRAAGGDATFVQADVTKFDQVEALVAAAEETYGRLDVMTANAGILGRGSGLSLTETSLEDFAQVIDVNVFGVVYSFRAAIPAILRAGGGAMTVTASTAAHRGLAKLDAYCTSKAAVVGLVRSLSADLAPAIRVNAVSPGSMTTELRAHTAELKGEPEAERSQWGNEKTPVAEPREVALAHLFLVSDEASFITGQALIADGGRTVLQA